ncbi:hypothetical protein EMIHUDRAFT_58599, partial [Emiliania huxleyi CCMP1516]|uniref:NAD-dependent epimerase/dehydratase domain-containing protein n=2 Tax=Emiliania huxleyi TaxID=2903 RepID=A0A0D3J8V5_EMIH1
ADGRLRWVGYLSTTSVYGDHDGGWPSRRTFSEPSPTGAHRLAAEREWLHVGQRAAAPPRACCFRLAGIYGPGRSALDTVARAAAVRADKGAGEGAGEGGGEGGPPPPPPVRYVSRIHVEDICAALLASMVQPA